MNRITNSKNIRIWSTIGLAAMISIGALATVIPAHAANMTKTAAQTAAAKVAQTAVAKDTGRIKDILAQAKQGKVQGSSFVSGKTNIKEVHKLWGASFESLGSGYERYDLSMGKGAYDFGISSKTGVVYDLRYYFPPTDPSRGLSKFTFNSVIAALGMPKEVKFNGNDKIYVYPAGDHQLKFVGSKTAPIGKSSDIDHINVYTPKADV